MTDRLLVRLARALGDLAVRTAPRRRADWAIGMRRELEHVERPGAALAFALGSLRTCATWRLRTIDGVVILGRFGLSLGTASLAGLCVYVAVIAAQPILLWIGLYHAGASVLAARGRLALLAGYAVLGLIGAASWWMVLSRGQGEGGPDARFQQALAVEEVAFLLLLLLASVGLRLLVGHSDGNEDGRPC